MEDNKLKWSLEKLLNTVGRNLAMNYYGFDSEYEVVSIIDEKTGEEVTDFNFGDTENKNLFLDTSSSYKEKIVRTSYTWNTAASQGLELGIEGAQTTQDSALRLGLAIGVFATSFSSFV